MRIAIVGGGIGGLVTALALHARGHAPVIHESVPQMRELGVGINLLPHAVRVLDDLGLTPALLESGIATAELLYFNKHGQRIWREPRGLEAGYAWPQISIHRGRLHGLLLQTAIARLGRGCIVNGHHLTGLENEGSAPVLSFATADGGKASVSCDLAIGADGIHSAVRRHFHPDEGPPIWNGAILWRAVCEGAPFLGGRSMFMAGHANQKFVCYPISAQHHREDRSLTNWVAELCFDPDRPFAREDWNRKVDRAVFLPAFADWRFDWLDIPALIDGAQEIYEYPMVDRDPVSRWSFGCCTLLGDAAHPMYPIGSNGASQAILDAEALALALQREDTIAGALSAYEATRLPPTAAIVRANRNQGPEQIMQLVEERAPEGFENLGDVVSQEELEGIAARYKQIAGFDRRTLDTMAAQHSS